MPCDQQPEATVKRALARLESALQGGQVKVTIGAAGGVAFTGWADRDREGVADLCAFRRLSAAGSWALRQAVARAEAQSGRRVNPAAIAGGVHSHDGGRTWAHGH